MIRVRTVLIVGLGLLVLGVTPETTTAQDRVNPQRVGSTRHQPNRTTTHTRGRKLDANLKLGSGGYNARRSQVQVINRNPYRPVRSRNGNLTYSTNSAFTPMVRYSATTFNQPFANQHHRRFRGYADSYR